MNAPRTDDIRISSIDPLVSPSTVVHEQPLSEAGANTVAKARGEAQHIIEGLDDRLLCVVGPCSIHDIDAAEEYARRLERVARETSDALLVVMRVYFEKPRTTVGWKGLINDPHLDGSFDIEAGLRTARKLLCTLAELGLPAGTEFLDPITPQYVADVISWGAIGARTTESQVHRELASGLSMPVGFKNGTDGNIQVAVDAIRAASSPHRFLSVTKSGAAAVVTTTGNRACHVILRGGSHGPNYGEADFSRVTELLEHARLVPRVMVDCSHGNSGKRPERQPVVASDLARRLAGGEKGLLGVMLESHLVGGRQELDAGKPLEFGKSITDACLGWEETVPVLHQLASAVRQRRDRVG
jgi:3-deoxy-7-phosphoheptulonate synthase